MSEDTATRTTNSSGTESEQLEAQVRFCMARLPKARGWDTKRVRDDEIAFIDALLDTWNEERRTA